MPFPRGQKHTEETKAKMRAAATGRRQSPEAIEKSASKRKGQKRTPEQRARMSAAMKGRTHRRVTCAVCQTSVAVNALSRHKCLDKAGVYGVWRIFMSYYGTGPWPCFFCDDDVTHLGDCGSEDGLVHHINHDHDDNRRENMTAAHHGCHTAYHNSVR